MLVDILMIDVGCEEVIEDASSPCHQHQLSKKASQAETIGGRLIRSIQILNFISQKREIERERRMNSISSSSGILPISILIPILPPLLLPTLLRAHAPSIIQNLDSKDSNLDAFILNLIQFDLNLPGLMPAIAISLLAATLTSMGVQATMNAFKGRGFKGRDLLKPGIKEEM